jgi:hypothetical protein
VQGLARLSRQGGPRYDDKIRSREKAAIGRRQPDVCIDSGPDPTVELRAPTWLDPSRPFL